MIAKQTFLSLLLLILALWLSGQDVPVTHIVKTEFESDPQHILVIDFIDQLPNLPFILAWQNADGDQFAHALTSSVKPLKLSLGAYDGWEGKIEMLGLSIEGVETTLRTPNFSDYWASFLRPKGLYPGIVNYTYTHFIGRIGWSWICFGLFVVTLVLLILSKKVVSSSLAIALVVSMLVYEGRYAMDRWGIMHQMAQSDFVPPVFQEISSFIEEAGPMIDQGSWAKENLSGILNSYCIYHLADKTYIRNLKNEKDNVDFIITTSSNGREVLHSQGIFQLVKATEDK